MKRIVLASVCLAFLAAVLPVFADETTVNLESKVIEDFNGKSGYQWRAMASKFTHADKDDEGKVTTQYPILADVAAYPMALYKRAKTGEQPDVKSLGIHGKFDRRGYNWIDIYPVKPDENGEVPKDEDGKEIASELPLPGRTKYLDIWVWGSNLNYYIEAYVRDYIGVVHSIRMGDIGYTGWKNLRANIPNSIPQAKRVLPRLESLTFVKFRIWTQPTERVDNFYIYFNQFKTLTDTFESLYDGDELADPEYVQELWTNAEKGDQGGGNAQGQNQNQQSQNQTQQQ